MTRSWVRWLAKQRISPWCAGGIWFIFAGLLSGYDTHAPGLINRLESLYYDIRLELSLALRPKAASETPILIIDIDAESLLAEGRWPWSREKVGRLVQALMDQGAATIAFDVVFSEPQRNPANQVIRAFLAQDESPDWLKELAEIAPNLDADEGFAQQLNESGGVLGFFFEENPNLKVGALPKPIKRLEPEAYEPLVVLKRPGYTGNLATLTESAAGGGFVTTFTDPDGIVRHSPLVIGFKGALYPSLSLAAAMHYLFIEEVAVETASIGTIDTLTGVRLLQDRVPTDARGFVNIPYKGGRQHYPYLSATKALRGQLKPEQVQDALVFVGTSAIGLADLRSTPVGPQYPGVEIHASIADALINGGFTYRPDWEAGATQVLLLVSILLLILIFHLIGAWGMVIGGGSLVAALLGFNFWLWQTHGLDLPGAAIIMGPTLISVVYLTEGFLRESQQRKRLKGMFDQYVPPAHIDHMIEDPESYGFQGEYKELTVLFSDIRGFTNISESLTANQLKLMLNEYFTPITEAIFDNEGTIDKYVGDMVMAFWGAPIEDERHPQHAVNAALKMLKLTEDLKSEFKEKGLPEINIGVGINTGFMNVGDMGSKFRRAYTVLGDAVNLGSRLESITKFYGVPFLISETTYLRTEGVLCQFIDKIQVKGKDEPVSVYRPFGYTSEADPSLIEELEQWSQVYSSYLKREWALAQKGLDRLITIAPRELYKVYSKRIRELEGQVLPDDWDGTFKHTSK